MKKYTFSLVAGLVLVSGSAFAQIGTKLENAGDKILQRAGQRAEQRTEQRINQKVDKAVDKSLDKAFNPNSGGSKSNNNSNSSSGNSSTTSGSGSTSTSGTTSNPTTGGSGTTTPSNKNKTSGLSNVKNNPNGTSATTATGIKPPAKIAESTFTGNFQWEIKHYKDGVLLPTNGHQLINFYVKPYDVAIHVLAPQTKARESALIFFRQESAAVLISEAQGTALKAKAAYSDLSKIVYSSTGESKKIGKAKCSAYKATHDGQTITIWVDDDASTDLFGSFRQGIGLQGPMGAVVTPMQYLSQMKAVIYEATIENPSSKEKTHIWLNNFTAGTPDDSNFDYSRYEVSTMNK